MQRITATVSGRPILAWRIAGVRPPVVCVHGAGVSSREFRPFLEVLGRRHDAWSVDLPGFGASDKHPRPLGLRALTDALTADRCRPGPDCAAGRVLWLPGGRRCRRPASGPGLEPYLDATTHYDEIRILLFNHGTDSIDLAGAQHGRPRTQGRSPDRRGRHRIPTRLRQFRLLASGTEQDPHPIPIGAAARRRQHSRSSRRPRRDHLAPDDMNHAALCHYGLVVPRTSSAIA